MKIILLGGQNIINKGWIEAVNEEFMKKHPHTEVLYYDHWEKEGVSADVETESSKLLNLLNDPSEKYYIFAKSIGTVILVNSLPNLPKNIKGALLLGVPLGLATKLGYDFTSLQRADFPLHIYQKELDPYCSFDQLIELSGGNVRVDKYDNPNEPNDDHHYADTRYLLTLFNKLVEA